LTDKFLFGTAFDEPNDRQAVPTRDRPQFSQDDLDAARAEAHAQGVAAGRAEAEAALEAAIAASLQTAAVQMEGLAAQQADALQRLDAEFVQLATLVGHKLAPTLIAVEPAAEIEALVRACINELRETPRLIVHAAEPLIERLEPRFDQLKSGVHFEGEVLIIADPAMAIGDCRVEWADGSAVRDFSEISSQIDQAVQRFTAQRAASVPVAETTPPAPQPVADPQPAAG